MVISVKDNDVFVEGSIISAVSQPANGGVTVNTDGTITYVPDDGFVGTDTFTYTATTPDGNNGDTATVTVVVTGGEQPAPPELPVISVSDVTVVEGDVAEVEISLSAPRCSVAITTRSPAPSRSRRVPRASRCSIRPTRMTCRKVLNSSR